MSSGQARGPSRSPTWLAGTWCLSWYLLPPRLRMNRRLGGRAEHGLSQARHVGCTSPKRQLSCHVRHLPHFLENRFVKVAYLRICAGDFRLNFWLSADGSCLHNSLGRTVLASVLLLNSHEESVFLN